MEKAYFDDPIVAAYIHVERVKTKDEIDRYIKAMKEANLHNTWLFVAYVERWKLDYFLDQAQNMNLSVVPVIQPRISIEEHPEVRVVNADGSFSNTPDWANIGCFNHPYLLHETKGIIQSFLTDYKDHPALYRMGGRPLISLVHEAYFRNELPEKGGGPLKPCCYCECCVEDFRAKMKGKHGSIERFNSKHRTSFASWEQMKPPREPRNASFWKEWFDYHADIIPAFLKKLIDYAKTIAPIASTHELNDFYPCTYQCVYSGNDFWRMANVLDVGHEDMYPLEFDHRHVIYVFEYPKDISRTAMGFNRLYTGNAQSFRSSQLGYEVPVESNSEQVYSTLAHGALGLVWWVDWKDLDRWMKTRESNEEYSKLVGALRDYEFSKAEVALIYPWTTMELKTDDIFNMDNVLFYMSLVRSGFPVDVVSEDQVANGLLQKRDYKVVCAVGCPTLPPEVSARIREFVEAGGTLISDYEGAGVDEFRSAFPDTIDTPSADHTIYTIETDLPLVSELNGKMVPVADRCEKLKAPEGVEVIARFENGDPAIIRFEQCRGSVVKAASLLGWDYSNYPGHFDFAVMFPFLIRRNETVRELISAILKTQGVQPPAESSNPDVEVAVWEGENKSLILVINHLDKPSETTVRIDSGSKVRRSVSDFFSREVLDSKTAKGKTEFRASLPKFRGRAYIVKIAPT